MKSVEIYAAFSITNAEIERIQLSGEDQFGEKIEFWEAPRYSDNISERGRYQIVEA